MSNSQPPQPPEMLSYIGNPALRPPNGAPARVPDGHVDELARWRLAGRDRPQESQDEGDWDRLVARELHHQELIEATFDRAEAHARLEDFEQALVWLDRASELAGGLPRAYRAARARWSRAGAPRAQALTSAGEGGLTERERVGGGR